MTTKFYAGITDAEIAPGQPVTTSLVSRLRDDPIAIMQNNPIAALLGLTGNFVSRLVAMPVPTTPPSGVSGNYVVPDGVHRLLVVAVGGGGCGSNGQDGSGNPLRGKGSASTFGTIFADGGAGNNTLNDYGGYANCVIGFRGAPAGYNGGNGSGTVFSPGALSGVGADLQAYGAGGGHAGGGGGAAGVAIQILQVTPGQSIPYFVGNSFDPAFLVGGGERGGPGLILVGW